MERLATYRQLIQDILLPMESWQHEPPTTRAEVVFDEKRDRYLLVVVGWFKDQNDYSTVVHLDIIDGKIWLYVDKTDQEIYEQLLEGGVPKHDIVKAWLSPAER
jgi:hypothetical protein